MSERKCETCRWWEKYSSRAGKCRSKAPFMDFGSSDARWPFTAPKDWCGDHAPKEEPTP
jgi:hypothetical protein